MHNLGSLRAVQFDLFRPFARRFRHGTFTRHGGVSPAPFASLNTVFATNDLRENVAENQRRVKMALGCPDAPMVVPSFAHGNRVAAIRQRADVTADFFTVPGTDAVITALPGILLFLGTADCNPIFFFEKKHGIIGLAHAGWRGVTANIAAETVQAILDLAPTAPKNIFAAVGPAIGPCCYRMADPEQTRLPAWKKYLLPGTDGLTAVDLWTALEDQLLAAGLPLQNIQLSRICTACHRADYFSYWSEKPRTGRFPSAIIRTAEGA